jgi:hypothetical protein
MNIRKQIYPNIWGLNLFGTFRLGLLPSKFQNSLGSNSTKLVERVWASSPKVKIRSILSRANLTPPYPCFTCSVLLCHSYRCWSWPSCRHGISMSATSTLGASIRTSFRRPLLQLGTDTNRYSSSMAIDKRRAHLVDPLPPPNLTSNWVVRHFSFVCSFEQAHRSLLPLMAFLVD